jgi:hypothetical protein
MVILQDIFNLLATGEFSNISLSRTATGGLQEEEYEKVIGHLNLGIIEIHKRFSFLQKELSLHLLPEIETYYLRANKVASLNNMGKRAYIEQPIQEELEGFLNIVEITSAFDAAGNAIRLNDRNSKPSLVMLSPDTLKITGFDTAQMIYIGYQAYPNKIEMGEDFDPKDCAVHISEVIIEALLYYVAGRVYQPTGSNDSTANSDKSQAYQQQYELACQKLDQFGLEPQHSDSTNNFEKEGWA